MFDQFKKWLPFKRGDKSAKRPSISQASMSPISQTQQSFHELFDRMGFHSPWNSEHENNWFGDFSPAAFSPSLDLADKAKHLEVTIELPGLDPDAIKVEVQNGSLIIQGEKHFEESTEDNGYYRTERSFGSFRRAIPLPTEVDSQHAEASFEKGILKILLPKSDSEPQSKSIAIKSA